MAYEGKGRKGGSGHYSKDSRKDGSDKPRGGDAGKRFGSGPKKDFQKKDGRKFGDRPKGHGRSPRKDFDNKGGKDGKFREGGRSDRPRRDDRESKRPYRDGRDDRGPKRPYRDRKDDRDSRRPYRDRRDERGAGSQYQDRREVPEELRKLLLPQDASKLLYRGIDCQINGNDNMAMIMFLHGSVMMSEGCENNAKRILKNLGKNGFIAMRTDIAPNCSHEALIEFDYICITLDSGFDRTAFDKAYAEGNTHAIYRRICLEEVEGDDPIIDEFASRYPDDEKKVIAGLDYLRRKKDSPSAEKHLERIQKSIELKRSVNVMFTRAMNGDAKAVSELKQYSKTVPEAAFYTEFLAARAEGNEVEWLRGKYPQYSEFIIAKQGEFKIQDTPFGMFLRAKNLESKKEEYMSVMMNAAKAGSPEAMDELSRKMFRNDVRKCLASIYLKENDLQNLIIVYQAGLDDMYYLDQYCAGDEQRIIEVGRELGKQSVGKEIDWLKDHYDKGMEFCKDELIERSKDEFYQNKKMVYTLHDIGADREAAELYFAMEGNPELPSYKWLKKVCIDDEVTAYVRAHFEEKDDLATFDSIFADDGYEKRPKRKQGSGGKSFGRPRR